MTSEHQNLHHLRRRRRRISNTVTCSDGTKKISFTHNLTAPKVLYEKWIQDMLGILATKTMTDIIVRGFIKEALEV
jgi:hypothetical protein